MADTTRPTLAIISLNGASADTGSTLRFKLAFSEAVIGVTAGALSLQTDKTVSGASILGVTGSGAEYVVEVRPGSGFGTLRLDVAADGIVDLSGNALQLGRVYSATGEQSIGGPAGDSTAGDVNGDGRPDIVVARSDSNVTVLLTSSQGSLSSGLAFTSGGINLSPLIVDLNRDGKADVLVGNFDNSVRVLIGNGDGTLASAVSYEVGPRSTGGLFNQPMSLAAGDIDGDGRIDVVANQSTGANLSILRGNGDGTFSTFRSLPLPYAAQGIALADFNGDGKLDILTQGISSVDILLGAGDGTFGAPASIAASQIAQAKVGDLNGDGRPDVVTLDRAGNLRSYINRGAATFDEKPSVLAGQIISALADLDGDGFVDAVAYSSNTFPVFDNWLLRGDGAGGFSPRTLLLGGSSSSVSGVGDFNGDGALDLHTRSFGSSLNLSVGTAIASVGASQPSPTVLLDDFAGNASTSGSLKVGGSAFGFIQQQGDQDWFRVDLVAGQTYRFTSLAFTGIAIVNASGGFLASGPSNGVDFSAATSGSYFVAVGAPRVLGTSYTVSMTQLASQASDFTADRDSVTIGVPGMAWRALGGDDAVTGSSGSDRIAGDSGNDWLSGGDVGLTADGEGLFRTYALLGRMPDAGGFQQLLNLSRNGFGFVASLVAGQSPEFATIYGGLSDVDFVSKLFTTALGRAPTADEALLWAQRLSVTTRSQAVVDFTGLPELQTRNAAAQADFAAARDRDHFGALHRLYDAAFDRDPDAVGLQGWMARLDLGLPLGDLARGFAGSLEFQNAIKGLTNEQIVTKLYANALGRAPDAAGLAGWTAALNQGLSLDSLLNGFAESIEARSATPTAPSGVVATVTQWSDTLDGGLGDDLLTGGRGADTFRFDRLEAGSDRIIAFESWDRLQFVNFGYTSRADVESRLTQSGADVVFADQGETITFVNSTLATVRAAAFDFV